MVAAVASRYFLTYGYRESLFIPHRTVYILGLQIGLDELSGPDSSNLEYLFEHQQ